MLTREEVVEIIRSLSALPSDKVVEVRDFVSYLQDRYGREPVVDQSDAWTEDDLRDLTAATMSHAYRTIWNEEERDG